MAKKQAIKKVSRKDIAEMTYSEVVETGSTSYKRLLSYVYPYKIRFGIGLFFGMLFGLSQGPFLVALMVIFSVVLSGTTADGGAISVPDLSMIPFIPEDFDILSYLPAGVREDSVMTVVLFCSFIPFLLAIRGLLGYISNYHLMWVGNRVLLDLRTQLYSGILRQPLSFFSTQKTGDLMQTVFNQTRMGAMAAVELVKAASKHPFTILSTLTFLIILDPLFAVCSLVVFPLCLLPVIHLSRKVRKAGGSEEEAAGQMMVNMQEAFAGIRVVKSHAREPYESKRFEQGARGMFAFMIRWQKAMEAVGPLVETVASIGIATGLFYAWKADIAAHQFFIMCMALIAIYPPVKALSRLQIMLEKCIVATTRVFAFIDRVPEIRDAEDAVDLIDPSGHIWFNGVTHEYKKGIPAVKDIHLELESGKFYALVGPSGAGKSTLFSMLMRFYDPSQGTIEVDGKDIKEVRQDSLRDNIGLVSQDTFLFHDTILDNIRYGRLDATDEECISAAIKADADTFIRDQEKGYKTVVGDQGANLSGGQKQRISIARAILRNPPILLLDEATSALDSEAEQKVKQALDELSEGKTVIAIAHRLSTVLEADQIVVMKDAQVVDTGTHDELLKSSTLYQRLYQLQFKGEDDLLAKDAAKKAAAKKWPKKG